MRELRPGLWHWKAPHPDWRPTEPWSEDVSSYAVDDGYRLLLFDPIAPPSEIHALTAERETAVVLTAPWHERDTQRLVEQLGRAGYHADARHRAGPHGQVRRHRRAGRRRQSRPRLVASREQGRGTPAPTHPATGCPSVPTRLPDTSGTTPCSGSRASVR